MPGENKELFTPCHGGYLQIDVRPGSVDENLKRVRKGLARLAPDAPGLVVLPELWAGGFAYDRIADLARQTPALLDSVRELAGRYRVLLAGSMIESGRGPQGQEFYNTLFVSGPDGVVASYRKNHLFPPIREDNYFKPGTNPKALATPLGRIAAMICYDLRFPESARRQARQGASLLIVSAQWPAVRLEQWRVLVRARAIENQIFVIACNRCGCDEGIEFAGHSMIVGPDGVVLQEAGPDEEAACRYLDPEQIRSFRSSFNTVAPIPFNDVSTDKISSRTALRTITRGYKDMGRKVVFTNGCFDILHAGHVTYLEEARREGDCLVIGLNSDASVRAIKGPERPINNQDDRARLLASLSCVDHVAVFDEETPHALIKELMPDVLVKGADWPLDKIVGAREVIAAGGRVVNVPLVSGKSTTSLIDRIKT